MMGTPSTSRWVSGGLVGLAAFVLQFAGVLAPLDNWVYDLWVSLTAIGRDGDQREWDVVVVGLDEKTVRAIPGCRGPGDPRLREPLARALAALRRHEPGAVAVDVMMTDRGIESIDRLLAEALRAMTTTKVILACRIVGGGDGSPQTVDLPYSPFLSACAGWGYSDVPEDADSTVRRVRMAGTTTLDVDPPRRILAEYLALAAVRAYRGWPPPARSGGSWEGRDAQALRWRIDTVDRSPLSLVPYPRLPGRIPVIEASRLIESGESDELVRALVKGKLVVFGATFPDCRDEVKTPFTSSIGHAWVGAGNALNRDHRRLENRSYGVEIVAGCAQAVLDSSFPTTAPAAARAVAFAGAGIVAAGDTATLAGWMARAALLLGATTAASFALFFAAAVFFTPVPFVLTLALVGVMRIWMRAIREGARKEFLERALSRYVSREICEAILANPELLRLPAHRVEVTALFCDLRGFTQRSEGLPPAEVLALIDEFLQEMAAAVVEHGGVVNKFLGDGLMAFWGAPLPMPDHALRGCRAGLAMLSRLAGLNERLQERGAARLEMGIGINSGPAVVGTVGSEDRLECTLLGDAVNVASRLQELTKAYGRPLIIGEATRRTVETVIATRRLDRTRVRGRHEPLDVFEASERPDPGAADYEAGLAACIEGRFGDAGTGFERAARASPGDPAARMMLDRARRLAGNPPEEWDGCWRW